MAPSSSSSSSSASSSKDASNIEVIALVTWLQSFPVFALKLVDGNQGRVAAGTVLDALSQVPTVRAIWKVAEEVCDASPISKNDNNDQTTAEDLWTSLLILTSTRARPLQTNNSGNDKAMSPSRLKGYVLSNLLDCAVQCPNIEMRRQYIQRIMALPKPIQKVLMSLIERRGKKKPSSSSKKSNSPPRSSSKGNEAVVAGISLSSSSSSSNVTPPPSEKKGLLRRGSSKSPPKPSASSSRTSSPFRSNRNVGATTPATTPASSTSAARIPHSTAKIYGGSSYNDNDGAVCSSSRIRDNSGSRSGSPLLTPALKRHASPSSTPATGNVKNTPSNNSEYGLSPGTMESPAQIQSIVNDLRKRNGQLQTVLETYQARQEEQAVAIDQLKGHHRQQLLRMEAEALDRQHEVALQHAAQLKRLQNELEASHLQAEAGKAALEELELAREEMDVLQHKSHLLQETSEKLRKYKEKMAELQDAKDALKGEQEAHAQAVDEIVRLERELGSLLGVKRQLDDYKIRAIEAEVKLVECQDYLQRVEQKANEQSVANDYLWQGAILQKEQLEELQQRIQAETRAGMEQQRNQGIGDGLSELNPELVQELARLRGENELLRDFAQKRERDSVQKLEEQMEDAQTLADRYKEEYLETRATLAQTKKQLEQAHDQLELLEKEVNEVTERLEESVRQGTSWQEMHHQTKSELEETKQYLENNKARVASLEEEVRETLERLESAERQGQSWHEKFIQCKDELEETKHYLENNKQRVSNLEQQVDELAEKHQVAENKASERLDKCLQAQTELDKTSAELETAGKMLAQLRESMTAWEVRNRELEQVEKTLGFELQARQDELMEVREHLGEAQKRQTESDAQLKRLLDQKGKVLAQLEAEKKSKSEALEEAHRSLQATRQVLLAKSRKEVEEIKGNMNCLLDDERRANRRKDEEYERRIHDLNAKWKKDWEELQERSSSSLKNSRDEAQDRIEFLKQEYQEDIAQAHEATANWKKQFLDCQERLEYLEKECQAEIEKARNEADALEKEYRAEIEKAHNEANEARNKLITKGKAMMQDAKSKAEDEIQLLEDERCTMEKRLDALEKEKDEVEKLLRSKINTLKQKLDISTGEIDNFTRETDELSETIKTLEREMHKLQEDNDRYRRQIGDRRSGDGKTQSQLDQIQKEYNAILQENRSLKSALKGHGGGQYQRDHHQHQVPNLTMSSISEESDSYCGGGGRDGGRTGNTLTQLRREYEETIESLNDEKRELVMKHTAALTDVQKAEQRTWDRDEEVQRLKSELQAMKLASARIDYAHERLHGSGEHHAEPNLSFFSANEELKSPNKSTLIDTSMDNIGGLRSRSCSPSLNRAKQVRAEHEAVLRDRISSLTSGTPPRVPRASIETSTSSAKTRDFSSSPAEKVLSPTRRHENSQSNTNHGYSPNRRKDSNTTTNNNNSSPNAKLSSDVYGIRGGQKNHSSPSPSRKSYNMPSLLDYTGSYDDRAGAQQAKDGKPECSQS